MNILQFKLIGNKAAIKKYKGRLVYILHGEKNMWFAGKGAFVSNKQLAKKYKLPDALRETKFYHEHSKVAFHFIDDFGEEKAKITDFDIEDAYNCPNVSFDNTVHCDLM